MYHPRAGLWVLSIFFSDSNPLSEYRTLVSGLDVIINVEKSEVQETILISIWSGKVGFKIA